MEKIFEIFLLSFLILKVNTIECGNNQIANCKECNLEDKEFNSCKTCEEGYFPILENLFCLPCNDSLYGQIGCKGECDGSNFAKSSFPYCKECKDGYYKVEGICEECRSVNPFCEKCTFEKEENSETKIFKCQKCLNEKEYRVNEEFRCVNCNVLLNNCKKCHFKGETGLFPICDECNEGHQLTSGNQCKECITYRINSGYCRSCLPDSSPECWCFLPYVFSGIECVKCPNDCNHCKFNNETNSTECLECYNGFSVTSLGKCIKCPEGCESCYLDENNTIKCSKCKSGKFIPDEDNKCLICPRNCLNCEYDSDKKKAICTECDYPSFFIPNSNECKSCDEISENGPGCSQCIYNITSKKYECQRCRVYSGELGKVSYFAYVENTFQCLPNYDSNIMGLYGCVTAIYNETRGTYEC